MTRYRKKGRVVQSPKSNLKRLLPILVGLLLIAGLYLLSRGRYVRFQGVSMEPNYPDGTVMRIKAIKLNELTRGDLVYFEFPLNPSRFFIKRVIGFPGEMIEIEGGHILVDGEVLEEPYRTISASYSGTWILGNDQYFLLGDNRPNSSDSQNWGPVSAEHILGLAIPVGQ